ncbi:cupin domain-containing protein [Chryseobacterium indologenes]|uniref:cupin domain-containing protein n=1 Tax=Chryseobacterium indologenes TaxID=253 RepID=UPI000F51128D|nr:cupin domain-containing protein [Chryseobacterium indologenes]AYZ35468.1 cupin domain-containing protein [Chryseobacterium indologenes]MBF6644221.1 cupin domain-containing protein [Chryseobacterium indologenes]MBU3047723.1 cupin domain-containing protein [Chryseobacterium indologenes]MEB4759820.1 cupin domain-containing protein [Chryseobacterium indologenes]QQQ72066.1 cupin domain-containing protein [Chryseobacterium indologenes]
MKKMIFIVSMLISITAMAQKSRIARKELLKASVNRKVTTAEIQEITMAGGQTAPKHVHPCPVVGIIKSGEAVFQIEGKESVVLHEGDAFYEPKNVNILHFDNASKEIPLVFTAIYLKKGQEENIRFLNQ